MHLATQAYHSKIRKYHSNLRKQIFQINITGLKIPTGGRQTSWLFTNMTEELNWGPPRNNSSLVVRAGLELATSGFQVRHPNHSATLPPWSPNQQHHLPCLRGHMSLHLGVKTMTLTVADPDLELRGGGAVFTLPCWPYSLLSFLLFYPK